MSTVPYEDRLVAWSEVRRRYLHCSRQHRNRLIKVGLFPAAIRISPNRLAWLESELVAWLEARKAERAA